jgi:ketosteroid isomerase-like protein
MNHHETDILAAELSALHRQARDTYRSKNLSEYMSLFTPDLTYRQANGRVIGRAELAADVASQLAKLDDAETSYIRESLQVDGDRVTELLTQTATVTVRYLVFLRRKWHLKRRGRYTWVKSPQGWKIREVEVLEEAIGPGAA